jgi:hypothetical protein
VLHPENADEDDDSAISISEHELPDLTVAVDSELDDELVVSEWPDPTSTKDVASLETHDEDTDTDASASGS